MYALYFAIKNLARMHDNLYDDVIYNDFIELHDNYRAPWKEQRKKLRRAFFLFNVVIPIMEFTIDLLRMIEKRTINKAKAIEYEDKYDDWETNVFYR